MICLKVVRYLTTLNAADRYIFVGDIGGTNSNFGICFVTKDGYITLAYSLHARSKEITDFSGAVAYVLDYVRQHFGITFKQGWFAAAGIVDRGSFCKPTNLDFVIDATAIKAQTGLESVIIINDFDAVAYGIDHVAPHDIITVQQGKSFANAQRAIVGAGTGLGKNIMVWDAERKRYMPVSSEGGHADISVYNQEELDLVESIQEEVGKDCPVSWEHVVSGIGIVRIYNFLTKRSKYQPSKYAQDIRKNGMHPDVIFSHAVHDKQCADTFNIFRRFYVRCAKNFALEALALNGLFIAGGIAAKNVSLFEQPLFTQLFTECNKHHATLRDIDVYLIKDYNVSLFGVAAFALHYERTQQTVRII